MVDMSVKEAISACFYLLVDGCAFQDQPLLFGLYSHEGDNPGKTGGPVMPRDHSSLLRLRHYWQLSVGILQQRAAQRGSAANLTFG